MFAVNLPCLYIIPLFILEISAKDYDKVNKGADSENSCRQQPEHSGSDFPHIKPVYSEVDLSDIFVPLPILWQFICPV